MWRNPPEPADLVTFTDEILNGIFVQWEAEVNLKKGDNLAFKSLGKKSINLFW